MSPLDEPPAKRCKREDGGVESTYDYELDLSVFDEMNALGSKGVAVIGLNSNCVELVLRSDCDQYVSEATVIRFRCSSEGIEKFGGNSLL
jgi:hypothetical protein